MKEEKVFYLHEHESAIRFTAAVKIDRETQKVDAAFAYVHPKDNFRKVRGRGISFSRLFRKPTAQFVIAANETVSDVMTTVRNIGLLHNEEQREKITELLNTNVYAH